MKDEVLQFSGILRDKKMNDKLFYDTNGERQNYPFCRIKHFDTQLNETIKKNQIKVPKVLKKTFGNYCN